MLEMNEYLSDFFYDIFREFVSYNALSPNTLKAYESRINSITGYLKKDFLAIQEHDAEQYFKKLYSEFYNHNIKKTSIYARWSSCNTLAEYIVENYEELSYKNPFKLIVREVPGHEVNHARIPDNFTIDSILSNVHDEMYYLVFSLAFRAALSEKEILELSIGQIQYTEHGCVISFRDKGRERIVTLPSDVALLLRNYVDNIEYINECGNLFYNKYGNPLSHTNVYMKLQKVLKRCGVENVYSIKDLRSRAILDMLLATAKDKYGSLNVSRYVGLQELRMGAYAKSGFIVSDSPAELVNIRVKEYGANDKSE